MLAILRRELNAYFSSAIGYVFLAMFYVISGFFFYISSLAGSTASMTGFFSNMFLLIMFILPILTMRLLSEDKKQKTDQLLLTAPVSLFSMVLGKYFAACIIYAMGLAVTVLYAIVLATFTVIEWAAIFGSIIGLLLMGMALIAVGMFISSLTENQVVAAIAGFVVMLLLYLVDSLASIISGLVPVAANILYGISFQQRYNTFAYGIFDFVSIFFFLSFAAVFIYLTVRVFEKRRWS